MADPRLERLEQIVNHFQDTLRQADAPAEFFHFVGVMNGMLKVYDRTGQAGIDFTRESEPLVALPSQVRYLEQRLNDLLKRIAGVSVKLKIE